MTKADKILEKKLTSCTGTAVAMFEAVVAGRVKLNPAEDDLPAHYTVEGVSFDDTKSGIDRMWASSALLLDAINSQLQGSRLKAGWKRENGKIVCWIEAFASEKLRPREATHHIRNVLAGILKEMPDPVKKFDGDKVPEPDAYWLGPFDFRKSEYVNAIMGLLLSFHGAESIKSQTFDLHNGMFAVKCSAAELQPFLLKEGFAARDLPPLQ